MILLNCQDLCFAYKEKQLLKGLNISYDNKDFLVITGPNGSGKSTLLKIFLGLNSKGLSFKGFLPKDFGYVPQYTYLEDSLYLRVIDLVLMGVKRDFGFYKTADKKRAFFALKTLKILDLWDKKLSLLSGGQRQKAFIARALCNKPSLLILDEPTSSVDNKAKYEIFDFLKALHEKGMGVIMVSHDIDTCLKYTKDILLLDDGLLLPL